MVVLSVLVNVTSVSMVSESVAVDPTSHMPVAPLSVAPSIMTLWSAAAVPAGKLNSTMSISSGVSPSDVWSAKFMVRGTGCLMVSSIAEAVGACVLFIVTAIPPATGSLVPSVTV